MNHFASLISAGDEVAKHASATAYGFSLENTVPFNTVRSSGKDGK
jgi:hypothetical protein